MKTFGKQDPETIVTIIADGLDACVDEKRGWNAKHQRAADLANAASDLLAVAEEIVALPFTLCQSTRTLEVSRELHEKIRHTIAKAHGTNILPPLQGPHKCQPVASVRAKAPK